MDFRKSTEQNVKMPTGGHDHVIYTPAHVHMVSLTTLFAFVMSLLETYDITMPTCLAHGGMYGYYLQKAT